MVDRTDQPPALSVILQIGPQRERAQRCLRCLLEQDAIERMEIVLLDYGALEFPRLAGGDHPSVRYLIKDSLEPFGRSRSAAVELATGAIVAFVEDHCFVHPGWASAVLAAHSQGFVGVGPEVHNGNPGAGISDAVQLVNYSRWLPPAEAGEANLIVGHNSSYVRASMLAYGEELAWLLRCDTVLQWRLAADGGRLGVSPEAKISHVNETDIPSMLRGAYLWNRMFAPTRARVFRWSAARRLAWLLLSPMVPFVRTAKLLLGILRRRRELFGQWVVAVPIAMASFSAAALGQFVGLSVGLGETEVSFLRFEISLDRRINPSPGDLSSG